jgi:hypothetical protein
LGSNASRRYARDARGMSAMPPIVCVAKVIAEKL